MFFVFMLTLFGHWTLNRTLRTLQREKFFPESAIVELHLVLVLVQILISSKFSHSFFATWVLSIAPFIASSAVSHVAVHTRTKKFKENFCHVLDLILLEMKSAKSFRTAFALSIEKVDSFSQQKLKLIGQRLSLSENEPDHEADSFVREVLAEFRRIDRNPHNSISRLTSFRQKLRMESEYRQRSGQATLQLKAQSLILTVLYLATFCYVAMSFGIQNFVLESVLSAFLFCLGLLVIFLYGRSYKWKV